MRSIGCCFFSLLLFAGKVATQELLANGGFEDENICTEYHVNCAPEAWISTTPGFDNYIKDAARCYEGTHCMAIEAGSTRFPYQRTFIRSQLLCPLKKGHPYRLTLFLRSPHLILDSMGVYFGSIDPLLERKPISRLAPSLFFVSNPENRFRKDSGWQKVFLDYTAEGEEDYITIAYFSKNDLMGQTGLLKENHFFVYADSISLVPLDPGEKRCDDWATTRQAIYDQDARHQFLAYIIRYPPPHSIPAWPPASKPDTLIIPDVLFESGKASLQGNGTGLLDRLLERMQMKQIDSVVIEGHTDNKGTDSLNRELSKARAETVANYIRQKDPQLSYLIWTRGWGSERPVAGNKDPAGRQRNRRVEVLLYGH